MKHPCPFQWKIEHECNGENAMMQRITQQQTVYTRKKVMELSEEALARRMIENLRTTSAIEQLQNRKESISRFATWVKTLIERSSLATKFWRHLVRMMEGQTAKSIENRTNNRSARSTVRWWEEVIIGMTRPHTGGYLEQTNYNLMQVGG